jgi:transcriptional regulator with XRE-family HTH domain
MQRPIGPATPLTLPMPWRRLRYNLWCIGWSQGELARRARLDESTIRQMCRGARRCPDELAVWVEQLAAIHRALWEPPVWEPTGKASETFMAPDPNDNPDDTEVAPVNPVLYPNRQDHPDRLARLSQREQLERHQRNLATRDLNVLDNEIS